MMDTLTRLSDLLQSMKSRSDQRASFLHCYTLMSENMLRAAHEKAFHDNEWMQRFVDHFATYYFQALDQYEQDKNSAPLVWTLAHNTALHGTCSILQKLLLGINAHINYDLVLTVDDLLYEEWNDLSEAKRAMRYADFCMVNEIIEKTVDAVQDLVLESESPSYELIDLSMGNLDEWLISRLIRTWRDEVWEQATALLHTKTGPERETFRAGLEARTLERGQAILFKKGWRSLKELW